MKRQTLTLPLFVMFLASSLSAEAPDTRFQWSSEKFATECGFDWASYLKAERVWFSDRNYSKQWARFQPEKLKTCDDCYRVGDLVDLPAGIRIARLTLSSESGDWFHEITYCYDRGGQLRAVMSIFNNDWSYVRVYSFEHGALKMQVSRWQELMSGKETSRPNTADDFKGQWSYMPIYKSSSKLPFARLVQQ